MRTTDKMVLFWDGWPSQWHTCTFKDKDGNVYNCAEQYMMAEKARFFADDEALRLIMAATSPGEQKKLGRKVGTFPGAVPFSPERWDQVCQMVVYQASLLKYTQNSDLKDLLLATGTRTLVEASPYDKIWGVGLRQDDPKIEDPAQWLGKNWLGDALMKTRATLLDPTPLKL